jgi:hypothetical protein
LLLKKQQNLQDFASFEDGEATLALIKPETLNSQKVEQGIDQTPSPVPLALLFEQFPIWLLTLAPNQVSHLSIMGFTTHDTLHCPAKKRALIST